jgi:hypothetical protein
VLRFEAHHQDVIWRVGQRLDGPLHCEHGGLCERRAWAGATSAAGAAVEATAQGHRRWGAPASPGTQAGQRAATAGGPAPSTVAGREGAGGQGGQGGEGGGRGGRGRTCSMLIESMTSRSTTHLRGGAAREVLGAVTSVQQGGPWQWLCVGSCSWRPPPVPTRTIFAPGRGRPEPEDKEVHRRVGAHAAHATPGAAVIWA